MIMIEKLKENYFKELQQKEEKCKAKIHELTAAGAVDEANLEKVRLNIYDIFSKMFAASLRKVDGTDIEKLYVSYLEFFDKIPSNWRENYQKAKEHGAVTEYVIEELKLQTADEIKELFMKHYNEL